MYVPIRTPKRIHIHSFLHPHRRRSSTSLHTQRSKTKHSNLQQHKKVQQLTVQYRKLPKSLQQNTSQHTQHAHNNSTFITWSPTPPKPVPVTIKTGQHKPNTNKPISRKILSRSDINCCRCEAKHLLLSVGKCVVSIGVNWGRHD